MNQRDKKQKTSKFEIVTARHVVLILAGLIIMVVTLLFGFQAGRNSFFELSFYMGPKAQHYSNVAEIFLLGLILFCYGLIDILRSIYFIKTVKKTKKHTSAS